MKEKKEYMTDWLTIEETAKYLDMGKTVLYKLAREGKIPSNKVGKKWLFDRTQVDAWVRSNKSIDSFFINTEYNIEDNLALREPQREAFLRVYEFFRRGGQKAIVQVPVGCGKSGLAALLPFGIAKGRVLVISPNLTIKEGLFEIFDISNRQKCFWRKTTVLKETDMVGGPFACTLDSGNISTCEESHIVITNIHQLATNMDKWLTQFSDNFFDLIIVDEGHHSAASSWEKVFQRFPYAKVVHMTATPFRSDRQEIEGELVYRYPFRSATLKGYIKRLKASYVAPSELTFTFRGDEKTYTLEDVLQLKDEEWFSRGVALSEVCNSSIVNNSLEKLEQLRLTGTKHQLIAVACSIDHARAIRSLYKERGYNAEVIHSQLDQDKKEDIMRDLKNGTLDCIIQVQMLGEGFDHPKLSVAAIFRPFRTLAPYIQFVGRILRVIVQNDPAHPDNYGHVVTHIGMNLDEQLKQFKQFENDDQAFWEEVIGGQDPEPAREVRNGKARMKIVEPAIANDEIVDSLFEEEFTTVEEEHIIAELEKKLELLGLDSSEAKSFVMKNKRETRFEKTKAAEPFPIQPQRQWEEARKRLDEQVRRTVNVLLNRTNLTFSGREIPYKLNTLGIAANNNFTACIMMVNEEVNKTVEGKKRNNWKLEDFIKAQNELSSILDKLARRIKKAQSYEESNKR